MRSYLCISIFSAGMVLGPGAFAEQPKVQPAVIETQYPSAVTQSPAVGPAPVAQTTWEVPPVLYQPATTPLPFIEARAAGLEVLGRAMEGARPGDAPGSAMADALMSLAALHYRYALAPEGLSLLARLDGADLSPPMEMRRAALELALGLIDPRGATVTDRAAALLGPDYAGWQDQPLFLALRAVRNGDLSAAAPFLGDARDRMDYFPPAYRAEFLPDLLEAAIHNGQWRVARDFAGEFHANPRLSSSSAFNYLLGRAAEAGGDHLAAFDSYALAGAAHDGYGHRGRLATIALALRNEFMTAEEARDLLFRESQIWRGDDSALMVLSDIAALDQSLGDPVGAITTYAAILDRFPDNPAAELARQKARALISEVYEAGVSGALPLSEFLVAHRQIAPDFRFEPGFATRAEQFADRFRELGSTLVAAQEYQSVHDHLAVARDLGLDDSVTDTRLDELRLKQSESLIYGGQYSAATQVLKDPLLSGEPELEDRRTQMLATLYAETGQSAAVLETSQQEPTVEFLQLRADARFDREEWAEAQSEYQAIWDRLGAEMPFESALQFLLSAFRSGDLDKATELGAAFPELTELPQWADIARGLTDTPAQVFPLRQDSATSRVENAGRTLDDLDAVAPETN
ncbi:hypothetical protein ACRARG_17580 [Pseudooceanicola sp. C21-150M6]|uniref:hypothetical protein n=1 Tax=Pseudooceanicola sp. C21-150M6 TaxID=3434355 RepID=UPI003D7FB956